MTNIIGSVNLIDSCAKNGFKYFINTGSSSEYGLKNSKMVETDLLEPLSAYGVTKSAFTLAAQSYAKIYKLPIVTLRLFSPYGYFDGQSRFVPTIIKSCLDNIPVNLSNPNYVRDFIFIDDVIDAYTYFLNGNKYYGEIFNINKKN
jgi:nucleoside-diphosphate-sugar epimerase